MNCVPGKNNILEDYLRITYLTTEQFRYGEVKRASEIKSFKSMYEGTLENIKALVDTLQRKIGVENESKNLKLQYENLIVERDNATRNCERLTQLHKESQNAEEIYKKKSRDLAETNLALQRRIGDFEASASSADYAKLHHQLQDCLRKNEQHRNKTKDLLFAKQKLEKRNEEQIQKASQEKNQIMQDLQKLRQDLDRRQDCLRKNEQHRNKTKDLLFAKQKLEKRNEEQIQKASQEKNQIMQDLQKLRQDLDRQNSESQSVIERRNEEIIHLKNALAQSQNKKEQIKPELSNEVSLTSTDEVDKQISSEPSSLNLQIGDNFVRKIHTNLLQSSSGKETCYNCRKLENELEQKVREINEIRKDEADFKNTGIKGIPTSQEYVAALYLKEKNELDSKKQELQRKNEKLTESLRSVQNELFEYKNPFGKPSYSELWKLHEEQKQQLNKSENKVKEIETAMQETQQKCANLEGNNIKLKEENEKKIKDCDKIQKEFDNIQTMLLKTQNGLAESKQREDTWKREETALRKMCKENNQQLIEKDDNIKKTEATLKEIQQKHLLLQANNEKFLSENEENVRVKNLLTRAEASLKEAQRNYQNLQENNEKLGKENETLIKEIKENQISLTQYKESEDKLKNNEADLRNVCEEIKRQLKEMEDKFKENETNLQESHQNYRSLQKDNKKLSEEKKKLAKEIKESFKGMQAALIQHKQKEEILKKTESELKDLLQKYSSLGEKNEELMKANNDYVEGIRLNQSKYEDTQSELKVVSDEFEAYKRNKKKEKDEEERRLNENERIAANAERQYNETKETSIKLKEQESVIKEKEKHLEESSTFLKNQEEILKNEMSKMKQREVAIDEKEGNLLIKETQMKKEEAACREKEENLKKIEADFGKSENELMSQIETLSEKNETLQLEKEETAKTYQQLLKQFVQAQEELKERKKSLEEKGERYKLIKNKLLKYEQGDEYLTYDEPLSQKSNVERQLKNQPVSLNQEKLKLKDSTEGYEEATYEPTQSLVVINKEEALKGKKERDLLVKNIDDKNVDLQEEFNNLKRQNENLLRQKEQGEAQIVELMQTGQHLQDEVKDVKQKLDESEKLLNIEFQKMKKLNEERKAAMEKCHYFERRLKSISEEKEHSLKKMNTLQGEVSVLQNTNNLLLKEKEEIENERSGIQEVLKKKNELTEEVSEQKIRIKNLLEERKKKYFDTNENMLEKYQLLQKENEQLGEKLNTTENNLQMLEAMKSQLLEGNQRLKNELEESRKDLGKHIILSAKKEEEIESRMKTEFMTKEQTLTNKLTEAMAVENNLRKEASALRQMNSDLIEQMVKANQEFSRLKQDVENLRIVYEQEKNKMEDNFRNARSELNNEILALKEGNGKLEKETKNILQRKQHLEKQMKEKSETIESKNKLVEKLNAELRSKHEEFAIKKKNWEDTESSLKKELTHVKQEVTKTEQEKGDLLQKCETLERELKNAQEQYRQKGDERFKSEAHNLENELASLKDSNKKLEKELNDALQIKINLENEIQVLKTDLGKYKNSTFQPTYEELSTRLRQIEAQVEERSTAVENKNKLLEEMERKLQGSDVVVEKIKTEFKIKEGEFNVEINKSAKIQKDLQNEVFILKQENADLRKKVTETNQENINLHHEHEINREQSQKNEESFKKEADRLKNEISALNDRTRQLEVDLNDALQKKIKLEEEIQVITNKLKRYNNPVAKPSYEELSKRLEQIEAQLQEKSSALESKNQLIENSEFLVKNKEMEVTAKLTQISKAETGEIIKQMKNEFKIKEDDINSKIRAYIESENNLEENISVLKLENLTVTGKMTKINQEHNKLRQELELLRLELNNKENVYVRQRQELEDISRRQTNDLNEISFLKDSNQKLENDIKTSANVNLKLENEIQTIRNDLRRYTNPTVKPSYEELENLLEEKQAIFERNENFIRERDNNFSKLEHALRNEIKELKQANASLIEERHAASTEKVKLLDEYESLKRELEARKIAYEEELNRYEESFKKEENDLRNIISVLKRENGVLQREMDNVLEEKHRLEELARTIQNKLKEKDALSENTNKLIKDSEQLLFAKDEKNRQLQQLMQQKNAILRSKEDEFRREMESFKHEKNLIFERNRILEDEKSFALIKHKEDLLDLKKYYEKVISTLTSNLSASSKEIEDIAYERDTLLAKQYEMEKIQTSNEQQQVLIREFEGKEVSLLEEISVLKNTNQRYSQDIEAMKIEMEKNDIENQLKTQKWVQNIDVQHPISKTISSAITSIGHLEEIAAKLNTDDMKNIQSNLRKEATQMYGRKIRDLNMGMLKMINEMDDADIRKQNAEFKDQLKLKHEDAERIESIFTLPDTIKHIKSNFEGAIQKILNETEKNLSELKQAVSVDGTIRYQIVIAQINAKYEEIVAMLSGELNRLQQIDSIIRNGISDMPKEIIADAADGRYVQESMKKINAINRNTRELELRVVKFRGTKDDKTYLDLNHKLMENIMQIDVIQVNGSEKIRERRRESVKYSSQCMEKLDANLIDKS